VVRGSRRRVPRRLACDSRRRDRQRPARRVGRPARDAFRRWDSRRAAAGGAGGDRRRVTVGGQEAQGVDVAEADAVSADAEVQPAVLARRGGGPQHCTPIDLLAYTHVDGGHRQVTRPPATTEDGHNATARTDPAGHHHHSRAGRPDGAPGRGREVDAPMAPALVRVWAEIERPQHGAAHRRPPSRSVRHGGGRLGGQPSEDQRQGDGGGTWHAATVRAAGRPAARFCGIGTVSCADWRELGADRNAAATRRGSDGLAAGQDSTAAR
jgi:hypothetical protein